MTKTTLTYQQAVNRQRWRDREVVKIERHSDSWRLYVRAGDYCEMNLDWVPPHGFLIEVING